MPEISDQQLIKDYFQGDAKALELLIARYLPLVYGYLLRFVRHAPDAEDITQEVFVKVWKQLKKFEPEKSFKAWILSIAKNTAIDFFRRKKIIPLAAFPPAFEDFLSETRADSKPLADESFDESLWLEKLRLAVASLSPKYREVFLLYYQDQLTFKEISLALKESINTVKSRYRRATIELKKILDK